MTFRNYLENSQYLSLCCFEVHQYTKSYPSQNMYDFGLLQFPEIIFSLSLRASPYAVLLALFP